jgi:GAF domain-containing protein
VSAPLLSSSGYRFGSLCFADYVPRTFSAGDVMLVNNLAELVSRRLEEQLQLKARLAGGQEPGLQLAFRKWAAAVRGSRLIGLAGPRSLPSGSLACAQGSAFARCAGFALQSELC